MGRLHIAGAGVSTAAMRKTPPPGELPGPGETLDQLIGDWWVFQLRGGHRFSTDDLLTAWRAAVARPDATRCLDLGCGIGSVGLYTLGILGRDDARLVGVEAQDISFGLATRSVRRNGLAGRVRLVHGDLRDPGVVPSDEGPFELITGSPPYIPIGKGVASPHPQRAACRMELRGSIVDYALAARRWLAPDGRFTFCMAAADPRIAEAVEAGGFVVTEWLDVVFREGNAPLIAVVTCRRAEDEGGPAPERSVITIRDASGRMSAEYAALRASFGFSVE